VYISEYYKKLFGNPEPSFVSLNEDRTEDIPQLSADENNLLTANFSMEEIHDAIFQMDHNKSPGPHDFPAEFYQHFWGSSNQIWWHCLGASRRVICRCTNLILG
jgi:hypothetical protein